MMILENAWSRETSNQYSTRPARPWTPALLTTSTGRVDEATRPLTGDIGTGASMTIGTTMSNLATLEYSLSFAPSSAFARQ